MQRGEKLVRLHLRSGDVVPALDRQLVDRAGRGVAAEALDVAGDDLDVENPSREARSPEDIAQRIVRAEEVRAALRVVDGQAEAGRDERCPDAADIVA